MNRQEIHKKKKKGEKETKEKRVKKIQKYVTVRMYIRATVVGEKEKDESDIMKTDNMID